jgi:hypothetical protein
MQLRRIPLLALSLLVLPLGAQQQNSQRNSELDRKSRLDWDTRPIASQVALGAVQAGLPAAQRAAWANFQRRSGSWSVQLDRRTGMVSNAMGAGIPMIPGSGNALRPERVRTRLEALGTPAALTSEVGAVVDASGIRLGEMELLTRDFIRQNAGLFPNLDESQLALNPKRSGNFGEDGYLWFIDYDQMVNGVRVDGARLTFRFNHGNLVQFGSDHWGVVRPDATAAAITPAQALQTGKDYLGDWDARRDTVARPPALSLQASVSYDRNDSFRDELGRGYTGAVGRGHYTHKLVYEMLLLRAGQPGSWLVRVSAEDGTVTEMRDINAYGVIKGGVYPGTASGKGTEIDIPLPFANYGSGLYADSAGNFSGTSGTTTLSGKYVKMVDTCGGVSSAANAGGVIDLSLGSGTDCTTPGAGGSGNTHATRSGYWWIDQIKQKARTFLPSNTWLAQQVTVNMNINQTCNANWSPSAGNLNFYKSGGGCGNTGELPDVFLHEFGHGLDQNDATGTSSESGTGEAYGDSTALTMGHHSCTGPGFLGSNCSGYGDACTACTGVRELDYHKRASNSPWTVAKNASTCPADTCVGPMGKECHCESQPLTQANWDLGQALVAKFGAGAGWVQFDKLWYLSRNTAGQGFQKISSTSGDGCGSANWLSTFLVVDDDNGNLADGTPNAGQIQAAYNTHGIGCASKTSTSTQAGATLATPAVTSSSTSTSVTLNWGAIGSATGYSVYKNMLGCSYGFIKLTGTTGTSYVDSQVSTAGTYYYAVQATGAAAAVSQFSTCLTITPSGATTTWALGGVITSSGSAAGISGVTVSTSGGSTTTGPNGAWAITGLANGSYTVTPSLSGYTFSPATRSATIASADVTGLNFTGTPTVTTYSITGAAGTPSATVSYSGAVSGSAVADASGNYSISGLTAGSYTLTPSKSGFTFSPASLSVTVGPNATGKNFTATPTGGGVTVLSNGVASASSVNGASANSAYKDFTIAVPSGATNLTIATTLASGDVDLYVKFGATPSLTVYDCRPYTGSGNESCPFATPSAGTYTIRVYNYATGSITFSVTASYTTGTTTYSIGGAAGSAGATVSYGAGSVTADASGNYLISSRPAGTYTITPTKSGCTFSPVSLSVTVGPSATGKNFVATCGGGDTPLTNGVTVTGQSVTLAAWKFYYITVPAGQTSITFSTGVSTTDIDIYAKLGSKPTSTTDAGVACKAETASGVETCSVTSPAAGTWWLGVYGYTASTNYSVTVSHAGSGDTPLTNGVYVTNQSVALQGWKYYYITIPAGQTSITFNTAVSTTDIDIYAKLGSKPIGTGDTGVACKAETGSGVETCTVTSPGGGTWWLGVYGYTASSNFSVRATY